MRRLAIVLMVILLATLALSSVQADTRRAIKDSVDMEITQTMGEVRALVADSAQPGTASEEGMFSLLWGVFEGVDAIDNPQQPNSPGGDPGPPPWAGGPGGRPHDDDGEDGPPYGPSDNTDPNHHHGNGLPPGHSHGNSPVVGFPGHTHPPDHGASPSEPY